MKIALTSILALTIIACVASASSASRALGEPKSDDYDDYDDYYYLDDTEILGYFEKQLRDFVFSIQQIVAEAGAGAQDFTAAADQLETSLNRGKLAELWSKLKTEIQKEPFAEIFDTEDFLEWFDPNLENLGTRGRTYARKVIRTIVTAINAHPNFPEQSITSDDAVVELFEEIYETLAVVFGTFGFLIINGGPQFFIYYVLSALQEYLYNGQSDNAPLKLIWSIVQEASQYIQEFFSTFMEDYTQFFINFNLNVNPNALPYFQIATTQVTETFAYYLNIIGEPFNKPGFVPALLEVAEKTLAAASIIVPKLLDQPDIWLTAMDSIEEVIEEYSEEFTVNGEEDLTAANLKLFYFGLFEKILQMSIFQ